MQLSRTLELPVRNPQRCRLKCEPPDELDRRFGQKPSFKRRVGNDRFGLTVCFSSCTANRGVYGKFRRAQLTLGTTGFKAAFAAISRPIEGTTDDQITPSPCFAANFWNRQEPSFGGRQLLAQSDPLRICHDFTKADTWAADICCAARAARMPGFAFHHQTVLPAVDLLEAAW